MPHDRFNRPLKIGDQVVIRATVTQVYQGETACNFAVEVNDCHQTGEFRPVMAFNSRLVELDESALAPSTVVG